MTALTLTLLMLVAPCEMPSQPELASIRGGPAPHGSGTQLTGGVSLLNLTGHAHALNFGNPFSGTHFGEGRTLRVDLRFDFR